MGFFLPYKPGIHVISPHVLLFLYEKKTWNQRTSNFCSFFTNFKTMGKKQKYKNKKEMKKKKPTKKKKQQKTKQWNNKK